MRQAYLEATRRLVLRELPVPGPGEGEVLVELEVSLTCGTDLKTYRRGHSRLPVPGPLGHEGAGRVVEVGRGVTGVHSGDRVTWLPTAPCGRCPNCRRGRENHCLTLFDQVVLGTHGDYVLLPARVVDRHLFPVPRGMDPAAAALLEPLACVVRAWRRLGEPGCVRTLVVGGGPIGLMHAALAAGRGPVACVGARGVRGVLASRLGVSLVVPSHLRQAVPELRQAGFGQVDVAIDCTGSREVWQNLPHLVAPGGIVLLFGGLAAGDEATFDATRLHYDEISLVGSFHFTTPDALSAMEFLTQHHPALSRLITHRAPLSAVVGVFAGLDRGPDTGKVALLPDPAGGRAAAWAADLGAGFPQAPEIRTPPTRGAASGGEGCGP